MAKTFNSVSFAILLVVLVMASTGILRSEAQTEILGTPDCFNKGVARCALPAERVFHGECGTEPFVGGNCECCKCCMQKYGTAPVCYAIVEGSDNHCHCYTHV